MYSRRCPAPPLALFIDTLWTSERDAALPHAREWNLPTGCADLIVPLTQDGLRRFDGTADAHGRWLPGGLLQGAQQRPALRDTSTPLAVVGVHFRAAGLGAFVDAPADAFSDRQIALDDVWPGFADSLREQLVGPRGLAPAARRLALLERLLLQRLRAGRTPDTMVGWALPRLAGGAHSVGEVQRASGCSPARFIERYRRACGLTPKRHAALLRFNTVLNRPRQEAWAVAAAEAGYADQAHLVREFRRFAGFTPGQYRRDATVFPNHVVCR